MALLDESLKTLLEAGKQNGHVTYEEVNTCLRDEAHDPEALDRVLRLLEENGVEVIDDE